jgi:hypothetical protein
MRYKNQLKNILTNPQQGFGSVSGFNQVSGFGSVFGIWIRIQEGKNDPQKYKKVKKFSCLMCWMFSFES